MTKVKSYFRLIVVLLSLCLVSLIALLFVLILGQDSEPRSQAEIEYLTVSIDENIAEKYAVEEMDAILINGGVIKTFLSDKYLVDTGLLNNTDGIELTPIDYLNALLNYIGDFGWELIDMGSKTLCFSRYQI